MHSFHTRSGDKNYKIKLHPVGVSVKQKILNRRLVVNISSICIKDLKNMETLISLKRAEVFKVLF